MNLKKAVFATAFLISGIYSNVSAQVFTPEAREVIKEQVYDYMNDLNIAQEDEVQFVNILRDQFIAVVALSETDFSQKTKRKIIKTTIKERDDKMKDLLSKDQFKVYKARLKLREAQIVEMSNQGNNA